MVWGADEATVHAIGTSAETAGKLARMLAEKRKMQHRFSTATTGKPLSKSDKVTNTIDVTYDYDFSIVGNEYFYAVTNAYFKSADLTT